MEVGDDSLHGLVFECDISSLDWQPRRFHCAGSSARLTLLADFDQWTGGAQEGSFHIGFDMLDAWMSLRVWQWPNVKQQTNPDQVHEENLCMRVSFRLDEC